MNDKRVVVTGLGLCCALGDNVSECWENALNGITGIRPVETVDAAECYANLGAELKKGAEVPDGRGTAENFDRSSMLCIKAAGEALKDAGIEITPENSEKIGVIVGNCVGGAASIDLYYNDWKKNGSETAEDVLRMTASAIANNTARHFGLSGVTANIVNACAAGTISISYACDLIRAGKAEAFCAGGSDAFTSLAFAGFHALHALDENPCSPFNNSHGITLGEGAGMLFVESYESAKKRGARIYCEILGSGVSSDAHHITAPDPEGKGQMLAINRAIEKSGLKPADIDYINAHGTGTAKNDEAEFLSLHTIFDETNDKLSVSSTKSMTGHCLGAAGSIEAVFTVKAVCENKLPPTIGYTDENIEALKEKAGKIDFVPNKMREKTVNFAASQSFAFGGNNASIVFSKNEHDIPDRTNPEKIFITGLGDYLSMKEENIDIQSDDYKNLGIKPAFWRKLDRFSQLMLVSGARSLADAKIEVTDEISRDVGIIIGTSDGPITEIVNFQKNVIENGTQSGSAFSFPNTVYNAAGGYFSIFAGIKGYNVTNANGAQAGIQSVCYAADVIRGGDAKIMVAAGVDENTDVTRELYTKLGLLTDENKIGEGACSIILETESSMRARGAKAYAELAGWATAHKSVDFGTLAGSETALEKAVLSALGQANIKPEQVSTIYDLHNNCGGVKDVISGTMKKIFPQWTDNSAQGLSEMRAAGAAYRVSKCARDLSENGGEYGLCVWCGTGGQYSAAVLKAAK